MSDALLEFTEIIDEEISAYENLSELYKIKQSILVQGKSDELWDIDAQIIKKADTIREINKKRKNSSVYVGNEDIKLSEIIEKTKEINEDLANKMQAQRVKLNLLAKSITLQEKTNMSLVKHGLTMVNKTIGIIVDVIAPHSTQYDKTGKNVDMDKDAIYSIEEEV